MRSDTPAKAGRKLHMPRTIKSTCTPAWLARCSTNRPRIFYFYNGGESTYLLASADWMQRNFDRRVEIAFPVLDPQHQARLKEILEIQLGDTAKSWRMQADGTFVRTQSEGAAHLRSQERLYEVMTNRSIPGLAAKSLRVD